MNRRTFITTAAATAIVPALPPMSAPVDQFTARDFIKFFAPPTTSDHLIDALAYQMEQINRATGIKAASLGSENT